MKYLISLFTILSLQGCYQVVNNADIEKAIHFCNGAENIVEISAGMFGGEKVICKNGNLAMTDNVKVTK